MSSTLTSTDSSSVGTSTQSSPSPSGSLSSSQSTSTSHTSSANYFFGFVVTFVVLLLIFVACGIGSRRRFAFLGSAWDRNADRSRQRMVKPSPVFWETWLKPAEDMGSVNWNSIQPISALFTRKSTEVVQEQPPRPQPHLYGGLAGGFIFLEGGRWRAKPAIPEPPDNPPEALQIAVMLAMPSPSRSLYHAANEGPSRRPDPRISTGGAPGEYQIGITSIPWAHGEIAGL
ncbi:hypothetical protein BJ138DRAFT_1146838 [Hygrophoropsis aurantiaca]|uniref:Uncharacterized protein n=1 Tax=Hygrophoropsis aurantiaca TaxID=72124 RepID=A0ACB8AI08_9AGAM|nr:hypothetical protein BJ138DRAFT_1146838 [Hygrophoropsis aurantiaca]